MPFAWVVEAKLILTDALMDRGAERRAARMVELSEQPDLDHQEEDEA